MGIIVLFIRDAVKYTRLRGCVCVCLCVCVFNAHKQINKTYQTSARAPTCSAVGGHPSVLFVANGEIELSGTSDVRQSKTPPPPPPPTEMKKSERREKPSPRQAGRMYIQSMAHTSASAAAARV